MAAISYDSVEILKSFADRKKIEFPMLADPDSKTIRAYEVLNAEATGQYKGMARPGYFFIDTKGIIREKFFEVKYRQRFSGNNVIGKLFPNLGRRSNRHGPIAALEPRRRTIGSNRLSRGPYRLDCRSATPARRPCLRSWDVRAISPSRL